MSYHAPTGEPDYTAWHALHARRQRAIAESRCTSCDASQQSRRTPAAYLWTCPNGNTEYLCTEHCAMWRGFAAEDPDLTPQSIRSIR